MALLTYLAEIATLVVVAYWLRVGKTFTIRGVIAFGLVVLAVLAFYSGFSLAVTEEARARYGSVATGVVVEKLSTTERDGTRYIGRHGGRNQAVRQPIVTITGFRMNDLLARWIVTGSPLAWVIVYTFPCPASQPCEVRDFVDKDYWERVHVGDRVNVRHADTEDTTARLDDNPQWGIALANIGFAAVLLLAAGLTTGRLPRFRTREWLTAPAVVTAVEPVRYKDATHWRVRFAYFDCDGTAQESADEVVTGAWKPGDDCIAVYRQHEPELATMKVRNPPAEAV